MSISQFMRISAIAADGLAPSRSNLPHHCRIAASFAFDGAKFGRLSTATPVFVDIADQRVKALIVRYPVEETRKGAIEDERLGPLGMARSEKRGERATF